MEKLEKQDVYHVADLAKLIVDESNVSKYETQLNDILSEIEKIENAEVDEDIMINSFTDSNVYNDDEISHIDKKEVLAMASKNNGDFIVVSRVLND